MELTANKDRGHKKLNLEVDTELFGDVKRVFFKKISKKTLFVLWVFLVALVAIVATYAYMLNNHPLVELSRMDVSNGLILEVDKTVYERGENVAITFTNNSTETVTFPDAGWSTIRDSAGRIVAPGMVATVVLPVPAGDSLTWIWHQLNALSNPTVMVPTGIYTVELYPRIADLSVKFEIVS